MIALVGPVENVGHPFGESHLHDIVRRVGIGGHDVYAFGSAWLERELAGKPLHLLPERPLEAIVCWDPFWAEKDGVDLLYHQSRKLGVPFVGVFGDWLAGYNSTIGYKTDEAFKLFDLIVTDPLGAAALRTLPPMQNPRSPLHKPVLELDDFLSYGRLPSLGGSVDDVLEIARNPYQEHREVDVAFVGYYHTDTQPFRPKVLEVARKFCEENGLVFKHDRQVSKGNMEALLLNTKVAINASIGTQLNCRVYEASACGAVLVSDASNVRSSEIDHFASLWWHPRDIVTQLDRLLLNSQAARIRTEMASDGAMWAAARSPAATWDRLLTEIQEALRLVRVDG